MRVCQPLLHVTGSELDFLQISGFRCPSAVARVLVRVSFALPSCKATFATGMEENLETKVGMEIRRGRSCTLGRYLTEYGVDMALLV